MSQQPEHPGDEAAADLIQQLDQINEHQLGIRTYTTTSPILVKAVQLTEDADWEAIAAWCGGELVSLGIKPDGKHVYGIAVPQAGDGDSAVLARWNDWIISGVTGSYFVRSPEEFAATYTPVFNRPPTGWVHDDGAACDAGFLAPRPYPERGKLWWCTEHQHHLLPSVAHGPAPATVRDAALKLIRKGYADPGATLPREFDQGPEQDETEPVWAWGARAALANLVDAGLLPSATPAPADAATVLLRPDEQDAARLLNAMETAPAALRATLPMAEWIRYGLTKLADAQAIAAGQQATP